MVYSGYMKKQIAFFFLALLLLISFSYSTKLVFIPNNSDNYSRSISNVNLNVDSNNNNNNNHKNIDIKNSYFLSKNANVQIVSDEEYLILKKQNKNIKEITNFDYNSIKPLQIYSAPSINANYIWSKGFIGNNLKIGVVDSGISYSSDAIGTKISSAYDFTSDNDVECLFEHGCLVSSVLVGNPLIGPSLTDPLNYKGVAYDANLVSAKIFNSSENCTLGDSDFYGVFDWVFSNGANYINNSWGSGKYSSCVSTGTVSDGLSNALLWDYYDYNTSINNNDLLLIFAAGNDGICASEKTLTNDCSAYNVLCVGSVDEQDTNDRSDDIYSYFSSRGPTDDNRKKPDLTAPGQSIVSEGFSDWGYWSGTSASSPHVTASASLLGSLGLNSLEVKALLINSADDINSSSWDKYTGWGYINLQNAYDQNSFSNEFEFDVDNFYYDNNLYNTLIYKSLDDYFYLDSNENAKCSLVWRRYFDNDSNPYLQNFDLNLIKDENTELSNSLIDNVEQINITNDNSNSYLSVSCIGDCYDMNYALACNLDYNRVIFDYYIANDTNFYTSDNNGNFKLYFNLSKLTEELFDSNLDINFDLNIHSSNSSQLFSVVDYNELVDYNLDLNSDYFPLDNYDIIIDYNYYSNDFNKSFSGLTNSNLNLYDVNYPENSDENIYYLSDFNLTKDFNFYDSYLYYLDYNDFNNNYLRDYNFDVNQIGYSLDFNAEDYNFLGKFNLDFNACNIFGNCLTKEIIVYAPYFDLENSYIDYDNNLLYYNADLNDLNFLFYYNTTKDYNIYLFGDTNLESLITKDQNNYYYDINLDSNLNYNSIILKDNNRDLNVFNLQLVLDEPPEFVTTSITKDFNILVTDFDLNTDRISILLDNLEQSYSVITDINNNYISGSGSSSVGTHTLDINVYDYANNLSTNQYSYVVVATSTSSSGGGGGSTTKIVVDTNASNVIVTQITPIKSLSDYNLQDVQDIDNTGYYVFESKLKPIIYFYDSNAKALTNIFIKVYDENSLIYSGFVSNRFVLDSNIFYDKNILVLGYYGESVLFKEQMFIPYIAPKTPIYDINNSTITPLQNDDINTTTIQKNKPNYILITFIFLIIVSCFCIWFFRKRSMIFKRYK